MPEDTLDDAVRTLARRIAGKSRAAVAIGKPAFHRQADMPLAEAYSYASAVMARNMAERDAGEGIDAFLQKRAPVWGRLALRPRVVRMVLVALPAASLTPGCGRG